MCAEEQLRAAGVDVAAVAGCMGRSDVDAPFDLLERELVAQGGTAAGGKIIILPTLVVNTNQASRQWRWQGGLVVWHWWCSTCGVA